MLNTRVLAAAGALALAGLLLPQLGRPGVIQRMPEALVTQYVDKYGEDARGRLLDWDTVLGAAG